MAKITPSWLLAGLSGKIGHDRIYIRQNRHSGKSHTMVVNNPYQGEKSEKQLKNQAKFGIIAHAVSEWIKTEKAQEGGTGSLAYNKVLAAFLSQHEYGSLRGFITHRYVEYDEEKQSAKVNV